MPEMRMNLHPIEESADRIIGCLHHAQIRLVAFMTHIVRQFPAYKNSGPILFEDLGNAADGIELQSAANVIQDCWIAGTLREFTSLKQFCKGDRVREYVFAMIILEHVSLTSQPAYVRGEKK